MLCWRKGEGSQPWSREGRGPGHRRVWTDRASGPEGLGSLWGPSGNKPNVTLGELVLEGDNSELMMQR